MRPIIRQQSKKYNEMLFPNLAFDNLIILAKKSPPFACHTKANYFSNAANTALLLSSE